MSRINETTNQITRIKTMEEYLDEILSLLEKDPFSIKKNENTHNKILLLKDYYENGEWIKDYEADERGEIPKSLKRGILAEDTLYNLFYELDQL